MQHGVRTHDPKVVESGLLCNESEKWDFVKASLMGCISQLTKMNRNLRIAEEWIASVGCRNVLQGMTRSYPLINGSGAKAQA